MENTALAFEKFLSLCGGFSMSQSLFKALGEIERLRIVLRTRSLELELRCIRLLDWQELRFLEKNLAERLSLLECRIIPHYAPSLLSPGYAEVLINELRRAAVPVNGFFENTAITLDGDCLSIALQNGGAQHLAECGVPEKLCELVLQQFDRVITVS
ncbi:MAG: hypothetical protein RR075_07115, partial [Pygmaiobacter sp.]